MKRTLVVAALLSGCVSQEVFDNLQADNSRTLAELGKKTTELNQTRADLQDLQRKAKDLESLRTADLEALEAFIASRSQH